MHAACAMAAAGKDPLPPRQALTLIRHARAEAAPRDNFMTQLRLMTPAVSVPPAEAEAARQGGIPGGAKRGPGGFDGAPAKRVAIGPRRPPGSPGEPSAEDGQPVGPEIGPAIGPSVHGTEEVGVGERTSVEPTEGAQDPSVAKKPG